MDDGAALTQSVYVLLNAVHAGLESELGTGTPGSLKTRISRLLKEAGDAAGREADFDRDFVHASWTPVHPWLKLDRHIPAGPDREVAWSGAL